MTPQPKPVKWREPRVLGGYFYGFYVAVTGTKNAYVVGPYRKTKESAIRAWNKQGAGRRDKQ